MDDESDQQVRILQRVVRTSEAGKAEGHWKPLVGLSLRTRESSSDSRYIELHALVSCISREGISHFETR